MSTNRIATDTDTVKTDFTVDNIAKWNLAKQMSITSDSSGMKLSGDATTPGNDKYYGTNGSGTKGYNSYTDAGLSTTDVTTNNASTTKHGFLLKATAPGAGVRNVVCIDNGETVYKDSALVDSTTPQPLGTAAPGTSLIASRMDHVHANLVDAIEFVIDGGGIAITTGVKGDLEIPYGCTINRATLLADQSGSIVVDIWKKAYATSSPPTVANTITASAKPTLSSAQSSQDSTLTGWTTAITAGDILRFNVDSITTCQRVTLSLKVTRT